MKDLNELLDKIETERARHYENSKETDGSDVDRCPACKSADITHQQARLMGIVLSYYVCNDCVEMWVESI